MDTLNIRVNANICIVIANAITMMCPSSLATICTYIVNIRVYIYIYMDRLKIWV